MEDSSEDESAIFIHGLSEKVLDENQNEEYNQSVVISTQLVLKLLFHTSEKDCHCQMCTK